MTIACPLVSGIWAKIYELRFLCTHTHTQYLGKTHNFWHGSAVMLEDRAHSSGELPVTPKEPPPYDGNYSEQILNPLKHVSIS